MSYVLISAAESGTEKQISGYQQVIHIAEMPSELNLTIVSYSSIVQKKNS